MQAVSRTIWLLAATKDVLLHYIHVPVLSNRKADLLSRLFITSLSNVDMVALKECKWWPVCGQWFYPNVLI